LVEECNFYFVSMRDIFLGEQGDHAYVYFLNEILMNGEEVGYNVCSKWNVLSNDALLCDSDTYIIIWPITTFQLAMQEVLKQL
jgi:hypothetical protein